MKNLSRRAYAITVLALVVVIFFSINIFTDAFFTTARIDLTANGQYTLAQGTRNVIAKLQEPVTLKFYYSKKVAARYATTAAYAKRVRDLLAEYAALSGGKIILQDVDPEPFTPEEDEATDAGITGAQTDSGDIVYFGLVGTNSIDAPQVISYFAPEREPYLEYDVTALLYRLSTPKQPVLGIVSALQLNQGAAEGQPLALYTELEENYSIVNLGTDFTSVPANVDVLLLVHPGGLTDNGLAAIDQFVLGGGRALVFIDPVSEIAINEESGGVQVSPTSNLEPLLRSWGVNYDPSNILVDKSLAQRVQTNDPRNPQETYPLWLHLSGGNFDNQDPITASLQTLNLASTGVLSPLKGATTKFLPLATSSNQAALIDRNQAMDVRSPGDLMALIPSVNRQYTIAARITGPAKSAYPNRDGLEQSRGPINVVVMADTDLFDDRFWVHVESIYGKRVAEPFADNGAFVLNAVENLAGSDDLTSLRTRGTNDHPFIVVQKLQSAAEAEFQQTAEALQAHLTATEQRLQELRQGGGSKPAAGSPALTPDQQAEIKQSQREVAETRAQLRDVQHNLRKDIDMLGNILAIINIALVPILIAGLAIVVGLVRRRRRVCPARP